MKIGDKAKVKIDGDRKPTFAEATVVEIYDKGYYNMVVYETKKGYKVCENVMKTKEELAKEKAEKERLEKEAEI